MEEYIKRIIQADLDAQEKMKQADCWEIQHVARVKEEKERVSKQSWKKAEAYVEESKRALDQQLQQENETSAMLYEEKVKELKQTFLQHQESWRQEIIDRCLK